MRENLIESKKEMIVDLTHTGWSLLSQYHQRAADGELTGEEARERVKERIRNIKYGPDNSYYFWIIDLQPQVIVHPYNTDLVNRDIAEYDNPGFREVVLEMADICRTEKQGFIEYEWDRVGYSGSIEPKLSFVRIFEPWDWIIGTGVYMNDVEEKISTITKSSSLMFGAFGFLGLIFSAFISFNGIVTERRLIRAKEQAEESDRLKSAFLANMSHEIRTPMNGIMGFADLLRVADLTDEKKDYYLSIINQSGERMLNIINDLIDISKIEAGQADLNVVKTNINELVGYIYNFFKPEAEKKGLSINCYQPLDDEEAMIMTDKDKLYAVLVNLIKNAVKYTKKGSIAFGYTKKSEYLEFSIEDTGIGIKEDRINSIFERFVQADIDDREVYEGAGLGLSISSAYVRMMGGDIGVVSEPDKGSRFFFTVPYHPV